MQFDEPILHIFQVLENHTLWLEYSKLDNGEYHLDHPELGNKTNFRANNYYLDKYTLKKLRKMLKMKVPRKKKQN